MGGVTHIGHSNLEKSLVAVIRVMVWRADGSKNSPALRHKRSVAQSSYCAELIAGKSLSVVDGTAKASLELVTGRVSRQVQPVEAGVRAGQPLHVVHLSSHDHEHHQ